MTRINEFHENCKYYRDDYPDNICISSAHANIKAMCRIYLVNVHDIQRDDDLPMCCISESPYAKQNCEFFTHKNNQTQLMNFKNVEPYKHPVSTKIQTKCSVQELVKVLR